MTDEINVRALLGEEDTGPVSLAVEPPAKESSAPPRPPTPPPSPPEGLRLEDWDKPLIVPEGEEPLEVTPPPKPRVIAPPRPPTPPPTFKERLLTQRTTQMGAVIVLGCAVFGVLQFTAEPASEAPPAWAPNAQGGFPKVEVDGFDRVVTHEDIRRVLDSVAPDEPPPPAPEAVRTGGLVRAQPGVLYTGDGTVGDTRPVIAGSVEETRRMRAEEARRVRQPPPPPPPREETSQDRLDRNAHLLYEPGGTLKIEGVTDAPKEPALELPVGASFEVELVVGVSSLAPTAVLAKTIEPVQGAHGRQILRKGAILKGTANVGDDRLFVTFRTVKSGGETYRFEGYAVDKKMPGIRAIVRGASGADRGRSGAGRGALGAAGSVLEEIVGDSLPGRVVRGVAEGTVPEAQEALRVDSGRVLELPRGRRFQVVVTAND